MRTEHIPGSLPPDVQKAVDKLHRQLADLQTEYQRRAQYFLDQLADLERYRGPPTVYVFPETEAERADMKRRLGNLNAAPDGT